MQRRVVMGVLAVGFLVLAGCGGGEAESAQPAAQPSAQPVTVETGGMVLPAASASEAMTNSAEAAATQGNGAEGVATVGEEPALAVGAVLVASGATAVYAEPDVHAPRFAQYAAGSQFTVVEPDGDYAAYPVVVDGVRWYRVRAEDGLVGWIRAEAGAFE